MARKGRDVRSAAASAAQPAAHYMTSDKLITSSHFSFQIIVTRDGAKQYHLLFFHELLRFKKRKEVPYAFDRKEVKDHG